MHGSACSYGDRKGVRSFYAHTGSAARHAPAFIAVGSISEPFSPISPSSLIVLFLSFTVRVLPASSLPPSRPYILSRHPSASLPSPPIRPSPAVVLLHLPRIPYTPHMHRAPLSPRFVRVLPSSSWYRYANVHRECTFRVLPTSVVSVRQRTP